MTRKFGPSWKQSTGHTSTQSMYLHLMQFSVTTKVIGALRTLTDDEKGDSTRRRALAGGVFCQSVAAAQNESYRTPLPLR
jgi:hypothetical protein